MSLTYPTMYSNVLTGLIKGRMDLLNKFDSAFSIPATAGAGVFYVDMLDTFVTETPSAGTFLAQGKANTLTALTLGHKFATDLYSVNTMDSLMSNPEDLRAVATKAADQLIQDLDAVIIAALKAGSITTNAATLTTTYIDFAVPGSTTTSASLIIQFMAPVNRYVAKVLAAKAGAPLSDFYILTPTTAFGNLLALAYDFPGAVPLRETAGGVDNRYTYRGIDMFAIDGTNFGGAGNEVMWIGHKEGYCFKFDGIRPWRGGVPVEDADGQVRRSWYARYAGGLVKESLLAEIVNPKS